MSEINQVNQGNQSNAALGVYRIKRLCELLDLGKTTIYELSRDDPDFPVPIKLTKQCSAWRADEVHAWLNSRERVQLKGTAQKCAEK